MPVDTHDPTAALSQLTTEITDAIRRYRAAEGRSDHALRELIGATIAVHESHAAALLTEIEAMGGRPEQVGAMMAAVRTAVRAAEDAPPGPPDHPPESELEEGRPGHSLIVHGERRLVAAYGEAIEAAAGHRGLREILQSQREVLERRIAALGGDRD
ncbi:DUF2383 domain-containing protein [Roseibacterium sp. SDUM158017]|uniref:DUF2383 domain-containing protein n=1 Tax=Roseicyclus salinarum TaxID=3036773 RepID=UPI00241517D0|nr:DUF2383 domain-containing protein [Roseibacterium sp. SDUM158017]MDG4647805.1 DUF2383 domain-containing protein [Roseibacterium sp. SDUM158017]